MIIKSLLVLTVSACVFSQQGPDQPALFPTPAGTSQDRRTELATAIARIIATIVDLIEQLTQEGTTRGAQSQTRTNVNAQSVVQNRALDSVGGVQDRIVQIQNIANRVQTGLQVGQNAANRTEQRLTESNNGQVNQQPQEVQNSNQNQNANQQLVVDQQNNQQQVITQQVVLDGQNVEQVEQQQQQATSGQVSEIPENLQNQQNRVPRDVNGNNVANGESFQSNIGQRDGVRNVNRGVIGNRGLGDNWNRRNSGIESGRNGNDNGQRRVPRELNSEDLAGKPRSNVEQSSGNNNKGLGNDRRSVVVRNLNDGDRGRDSRRGTDDQNRGQNWNVRDSSRRVRETAVLPNWNSQRNWDGQQQRNTVNERNVARSIVLRHNGNNDDSLANRGDGKERNPRDIDGASDWDVRGRRGRVWSDGRSDRDGNGSGKRQDRQGRNRDGGRAAGRSAPIGRGGRSGSRSL